MIFISCQKINFNLSGFSAGVIFLWIMRVVFMGHPSVSHYKLGDDYRPIYSAHSGPGSYRVTDWCEAI